MDTSRRRPFRLQYFSPNKTLNERDQPIMNITSYDMSSSRNKPELCTPQIHRSAIVKDNRVNRGNLSPVQLMMKEYTKYKQRHKGIPELFSPARFLSPEAYNTMQRTMLSEMRSKSSNKKSQAINLFNNIKLKFKKRRCVKKIFVNKKNEAKRNFKINTIQKQLKSERMKELRDIKVADLETPKNIALNSNAMRLKQSLLNYRRQNVVGGRKYSIIENPNPLLFPIIHKQVSPLTPASVVPVTTIDPQNQFLDLLTKESDLQKVDNDMDEIRSVSSASSHRDYVHCTFTFKTLDGDIKTNDKPEIIEASKENNARIDHSSEDNSEQHSEQNLYEHDKESRSKIVHEERARTTKHVRSKMSTFRKFALSKLRRHRHDESDKSD